MVTSAQFESFVGFDVIEFCVREDKLLADDVAFGLSPNGEGSLFIFGELRLPKKFLKRFGELAVFDLFVLVCGAHCSGFKSFFLVIWGLFGTGANNFSNLPISTVPWDDIFTTGLLPRFVDCLVTSFNLITCSELYNSCNKGRDKSFTNSTLIILSSMSCYYVWENLF